MPENKLVIIHGWSDHANNFVHLAGHLSQALQRPVELIHLTKWVSLDDFVTYDDLAHGLDRAWDHVGLPRSGRQVDVVTHSTGSLLIRHWLVRYFQPDVVPPIKRLLQLAPANFGSPLAHMGRSVIGRARNAYQTATGSKQSDLRRAFEPGAELLHGLELASPFTWQLAEQDAFGDHRALYGPGKILASVLIGNEGTVVVADFDGSDGVIRTACANLNCARATVDFLPNPTKPEEQEVSLSYQATPRLAAFRVLNGFSHGDVVLNQPLLSRKGKGEGRRELKVSEQDALALMVQALQVEDDTIEAWCDACDQATSDLTAALDQHADDEVHGHLNLVVRVRNQYGHPVDDYVLEIYDDDDFDADGRPKAKKSRLLTMEFQKHAVDDVHTNRRNPSYRSFHIDCAELHKRITPHLSKGLYLSLTAAPLIRAEADGGCRCAGYYGFDDTEIGHAFIPKEELPILFQPHTTLLLTITLCRCQTPEIVEIVGANT